MDIKQIKDRGKVHRKIKIKRRKEETKNGMTKNIDEREYEYCDCDYCRDEIILCHFQGRTKKTIRWGEQTGGISKIYDVEYALCNKCIKPALKEIEDYEYKVRKEREGK